MVSLEKYLADSSAQIQREQQENWDLALRAAALNTSKNFDRRMQLLTTMNEKQGPSKTTVVESLVFLAVLPEIVWILGIVGPIFILAYWILFLTIAGAFQLIRKPPKISSISRDSVLTLPAKVTFTCSTEMAQDGKIIAIVQRSKGILLEQTKIELDSDDPLEVSSALEQVEERVKQLQVAADNTFEKGLLSNDFFGKNEQTLVIEWDVKLNDAIDRRLSNGLLAESFNKNIEEDHQLSE